MSIEHGSNPVNNSEPAIDPAVEWAEAFIVEAYRKVYLDALYWRRHIAEQPIME